MGRLLGAWAALVDLVLPAACAGCGRAATSLCPGCARALAGPAAAAWPDPAPPGLPPPFAVAAYDGAVRDAILAHKEHGRRSLAAPLGAALATAVEAALPTANLPMPARPVVLVPMPSRSAAVRARGRDPTLAMARAAAGVLRGRGRPAAVRPVLRLTGSVLDQAGLDAAARLANLAGAVLLPPRLLPVLARALDGPGERGRTGPASPRPVLVLVDDVVTTGASLAAAAAALARAGRPVDGAALVAATRRRR